MRDKLKDKVRKHFEAGEMTEGFACLEALEAEAFFSFLFRNNKWITEGVVSAYFWKSYLPASPYFDAAMCGEQAINLLHHYFSKNRDTSEAGTIFRRSGFIISLSPPLSKMITGSSATGI